MHNLDWDDLRYFLAVARAGSLSGAAKSLGVNHSTVLRRLSGLKARLDARLFERFQSGYSMTAAGEDSTNCCSARAQGLAANESLRLRQ